MHSVASNSAVTRGPRKEKTKHQVTRKTQSREDKVKIMIRHAAAHVPTTGTITPVASTLIALRASTFSSGLMVVIGVDIICDDFS